MVKCANCGAMVPAEKAFCPNCQEPMEAEEQRRDKRAIENMAATVVGFSLSQLQEGGVPAAKPQAPKPPEVKPEPAKPMPPPDPKPPANTSSGGSKMIFLAVGGVVLIGVVLVVAVVALYALGYIKF